MPGARWCRRVANPLDRRAFAFLEFPQHEVVLERIGTQRQIVAAGLEIEQDAGALIDAAGDALEAQRYFAVMKILDVLGDRVREIGERLHAIEELGIALAIERARLVGDAGRSLAFLPLPPVDGEHLVVALRLDPPDADDVHERGRVGTDRLVREVELQRLARGSARQTGCQCDPCKRYGFGVVLDAHGLPPSSTNRSGMWGARQLHPHASTISS